MANKSATQRNITIIFTITFMVFISHISLGVYKNLNLHWVYLSIMFFVLEEDMPRITPLGSFAIGLLMDLMTGKILGVYGGIYALSSYLTIVLRVQYRHGQFLKKSFVVFTLISIFHMACLWEAYIFYHVPFRASWSILFNLLLFAPLCIALRKIRSSYTGRAVHE